MSNEISTTLRAASPTTATAAVMPRATFPRVLTQLVAAAVTVSVLAVASGCEKSSEAAPSAAADPAAAAQGSQVREGAQPYTITTATVGECKAGAECTATITIEATGDYHVNESYPFKFTAAAPGVEFHGASGNVYTGADFVRQGKTKGVMTLKFKPAAKGDVAITGVYKICICTDKICQPTTTNVTVNVSVK